MLKRVDSLYAFKQHGVHIKRMTATGQAVGDCPFCQKEEHFYIHEEKQLWDCKACGESGTIKTFILKIWQRSVKEFKGKNAVSLQTDRSIAIETFRRNGIGFNSINKTYTIPVHRLDKETLHDLRFFKIGRSGVHSTSGMAVGLFNWEKIAGANTIWLCEGEWDALVMDEIIHELGLKKCCAVGVPGANTFKAEWASLFTKKEVNVLYDADEYGRAGMIKVGNILSAVTNKLKFIHWPEKSVIGYDIRDLYKDTLKSVQKTFKKIESLLKDTPPESTTVTQITASIQKDEFTGKGLTAEEAYARYRKWLYFPDDSVLISALFGAILANRRDGDPLWLFIVAPPGATKSELLLSLADAPKIVSTTSLTPAALISGATFAGGGDPSLIPRLNNQILIVKDFTTILNMPPQNRDSIFGILRDAYDGKIEWQFGNGIHRKYNSKFGLIAGVTPAIEQFSEGCAALGERFLQLWVPHMTIREQRAYLQKARENEGKESAMRQELLDTAKDILSKNYTMVPTITKKSSDTLLDLAQTTSILRGIVPRDKFTKDITHRSYHELGTRLTKQYVKYAIGIGQFHGVNELSEREISVVRTVARSSVPTGIRAVLRVAYKQFKEKPFDLKTISSAVKLPAHPTVSRLLQNLCSLGVLREHSLSALKSEFVFSDDILELLDSSQLFN